MPLDREERPLSRWASGLEPGSGWPDLNRPLRPEVAHVGGSRSERAGGEPLTSTNGLEGSAVAGRESSALAPRSDSRGPRVALNQASREGTAQDRPRGPVV